ncbi:hypothetical protein IEO21_08215 [Rhodonia placenta]|uniref:mRNA export factor GLE1 n=1 Tax=Rhodonia placenta TaxID=104341 RepID=A0A8H7TZG4_9APHY|nr:hypothetical protein IEO21_08215 [Postia placenta]
MRFHAPRSASPSPERGSYRSQSTYGLNSESDDDSDAESAASSASTDSFCYRSESEVPPPPPRPQRPPRSAAEEYYVKDFLTSIRIRVNHHDPYEEFKRKTHEESLHVARVNQALDKRERHQKQKQTHAAMTQIRTSHHQKQVEAVQAALAHVSLQQEALERGLRERWNARNRALWEGLEGVIRQEEEKVRTRLAEEERQREEEARVRREEEERQRAKEEQKRKEEEQKLREEEERKRKEEEQAAEAKRREEEAKTRKESLAAQKKKRELLGYTIGPEDFKYAQDTLSSLKRFRMRVVKSDPKLKAAWNAARRVITPKIGQLTDDPAAIARISEEICKTISAHSQPVFHALLSSLAKAILVQAETEVTAEPRSAVPLAQVTAALLVDLMDFEDIFWAKFTQRAGNWPAAAPTPTRDAAGALLDPTARLALMGARKDEPAAAYAARVVGLMRVYFHVLRTNVPRPLKGPFRTTRLWTWLVRLLQTPALHGYTIAPYSVHALLEIAGDDGREIWGAQWAKLLEVLYEGVTTGLGGDETRLIGGKSDEAVAARARVRVEIERLLAS